MVSLTITERYKKGHSKVRSEANSSLKRRRGVVRCMCDYEVDIACLAKDTPLSDRSQNGHDVLACVFILTPKLKKCRVVHSAPLLV
jgi:hypothetical protein